MPIENFEVEIIGAGYVGLATGACLAHLGHRVTCLDKDDERVRSLEEGLVPFYEPDLGGPDISRARAGLSWEPRTSASEGLRKTLVWFAELSGGASRRGSSSLQ